MQVRPVSLLRQPERTFNVITIQQDCALRAYISFSPSLQLVPQTLLTRGRDFLVPPIIHGDIITPFSLRRRRSATTTTETASE